MVGAMMRTIMQVVTGMVEIAVNHMTLRKIGNNIAQHVYVLIQTHHHHQPLQHQQQQQQQQQPQLLLLLLLAVLHRVGKEMVGAMMRTIMQVVTGMVEIAVNHMTLRKIGNNIAQHVYVLIQTHQHQPPLQLQQLLQPPLQQLPPPPPPPPPRQQQQLPLLLPLRAQMVLHVV